MSTNKERERRYSQIYIVVRDEQNHRVLLGSADNEATRRRQIKTGTDKKTVWFLIIK